MKLKGQAGGLSPISSWSVDAKTLRKAYRGLGWSKELWSGIARSLGLSYIPRELLLESKLAAKSTYSP